MIESDILNAIIDNLKVSGKYILIRDKLGNIIFPKDLESINEIERLIKLKTNGKELFDKETGNNYIVKSSVFCLDGNEYLFDLIENNNRFKVIEKKARFDDTTNLLNKDSIMTILDQYILNKDKNIKSIGIVACDIDKFKNINDTYGHLAGDKILEELSNIFKKYICSNCSIGRFGGDEFVIVFKNIDDKTVSNNIEKLKEEVNKTVVKFDNYNIDNITMSFGIYTCSYENMNFTSLSDIVNERMRMFYCADEALYESKNTGRNKITIYNCDEFNNYVIPEQTINDQV